MDIILNSLDFQGIPSCKWKGMKKRCALIDRESMFKDTIHLAHSSLVLTVAHTTTVASSASGRATWTVLGFSLHKSENA